MGPTDVDVAPAPYKNYLNKDFSDLRSLWCVWASTGILRGFGRMIFRCCCGGNWWYCGGNNLSSASLPDWYISAVIKYNIQLNFLRWSPAWLFRYTFVFWFEVILYVSVNNFQLCRIFLGWISKQGLINVSCSRKQCRDSSEAQTLNPYVLLSLNSLLIGIHLQASS